MEVEISLTVLLSIAGIIASIASSTAVVKTKVTQVENALRSNDQRTDSVREELQQYKAAEDVRVALLKSNQEAHARELADLKNDIKTIMNNVQEIKEAILEESIAKKRKE